MELNLDITGGLMHFLAGHGPFRQKLHAMNIVEDNLCHSCGGVATPEHRNQHCRETEHLVVQEIEVLKGMPVA